MNQIDILIGKIEALQFSEDTQYFDKGMLATQRFHIIKSYYREDNTIFFPAVAAFTLLQYFDTYTKTQQKRVQKIVEGIKSNYPKYKSPTYPYLYNFYRTNPHDQYPNGIFLSKFRHFVLAEDADDTSMITMTLDPISEDRKMTVRNKLIEFANLTRKKIRHVDKKYAKLPAYGIWFGSGALAIEYDICVTCNIMCFIFKYQFELNEQDLASLEYIRIAIEDEEIIHNVFELSYLYQDTSIILYHIARLCSFMDDPARFFPMEKIIAIAQDRLAQSQNQFEQVLLCSSLIKLGLRPKRVNYVLADIEKEMDKFAFFNAGMLGGTRSRLLKWLNQYPLVHLCYKCMGYYYTLLIEYETLMNLEE